MVNHVVIFFVVLKLVSTSLSYWLTARHGPVFFLGSCQVLVMQSFAVSFRTCGRRRRSPHRPCPFSALIRDLVRLAPLVFSSAPVCHQLTLPVKPLGVFHNGDVVGCNASSSTAVSSITSSIWTSSFVQIAVQSDHALQTGILVIAHHFADLDCFVCVSVVLRDSGVVATLH